MHSSGGGKNCGIRIARLPGQSKRRIARYKSTGIHPKTDPATQACLETETVIERKFRSRAQILCVAPQRINGDGLRMGIRTKNRSPKANRQAWTEALGRLVPQLITW